MLSVCVETFLCFPKFCLRIGGRFCVRHSISVHIKVGKEGESFGGDGPEVLQRNATRISLYVRALAFKRG